MNGNQDQGGDNDEGIDLGEQDEPSPAIGGGPPQQSEPQYPTVMLHGGPGLQQIADTGVHKIHAKVISRHMPSRHNKHHRVELEIHKIKPQRKRGRPSSSKHEEDEASIKKEMEQVGE